MTDGEKRAAVIAMLAAGATHRAIIAAPGVTWHFIRMARDGHAPLPAGTRRKYRTKWGTESTMRVDRIGRGRTAGDGGV